MSGIEGHNGYYLKKTGDRVNELLSRQFVVPTLANAPTEDTVSWEDREYTVDFRIGEFCRIYQGDDYAFYRLHDLKDGKAVWKEASSVDLSNYYTKVEVDKKISEIVVTGGGGGVEVLSPEDYAAKVEGGSIIDNTIYFLVENGEPYELYIGLLLIAQKGEIGDVGFPYTFPMVF